MKRLSLGAVLFLSACSSVIPDAGYEAVLIRKPMFFGSGGVDSGRQYVAWTTDAVYVNMQPIRLDLVFDDLMTSNGVPLDFHAVISCRVTNSVKLVEGFGSDSDPKTGQPGWFARNLEQPFRTAVRDAVKKHAMNEMAITSTASEQVDAEVTGHLGMLIMESGVPVLCRDISLGRANPPDAIKDQRIATAAQEQRIQTEEQRKLAEDQRKAAENSRAAADNAYRVSMQLNPEQFLQLESIKAMRDVCGTGKCTIYTTGVLPTFGIK